MASDDSYARLADRLAIQDLRYRYCYLIDDVDLDVLPELFTEDVSLDYGGMGTYEGHEGVAAFADFVESELERTTHLVTNSLIDVDGDRATGRHYVISSITYADGTGGWRIGQYVDEYRCVDGEWLISDGRMRFTHSMDYDPESGWPDFTPHR
ncbi:nuclear transport factor 2 family protein [Natrialbaceae archaeon GCM10025810]|uniref:nuclear transport factor 2 family protein n=1 Tax=Halovalidus salilacus TaxID=3075124 RepID=UPI00360C921D